MKDTVKITKNSKGFKVKRVLEETLSEEEIKNRIRTIDLDLERCNDALEDLVENREQKMKERAESVDKDIEEYRKAMDKLNASRKALFDALENGTGIASAETEGNTVQGGV